MIVRLHSKSTGRWTKPKAATELELELEDGQRWIVAPIYQDGQPVRPTITRASTAQGRRAGNARSPDHSQGHVVLRGH